MTAQNRSEFQAIFCRQRVKRHQMWIARAQRGPAQRSARHFDLGVDSGKGGIEKPDPRIFRIALDNFAVKPERALHLGDVFATDVLGARAAGVRHALIDPYKHYAGRHAEVPRVPGVVAVARAIQAARAR